MSHLRFKAVELASSRPVIPVKAPSGRISDYFGKNVFGPVALQTYLSSDKYKKFKAIIERGDKMSDDIADSVAAAMKSWATERGVTHFTHWFQPLRGSTAEKHDAFFEPKSDGSRAIELFRGSELVRQEPDASSFPSGGLRNTFEARGYSAWDPTSPAFIIESGGGKTLCIPSIFVSYTGEALDFKAPLLKSVELLDKAAVAVCQYFDKAVSKVQTTLGVEQEFFLIDKAFAAARPDLIMGGRTIFGHSPARGQQLSDHYFGAIPGRVKRFMQDFEIESLKLGIPIRTRHNEVAPAQYECAPVFEEVNLAVDHNSLLMDIMAKVADAHNFQVMFHEKPFANVNGSGKHNNWSLQTDTGRNLLSPSSKAKENLQFLTFLVNTTAAVHRHADLMRAAIASDGNDYRLGANEAPPAIISVFLGSQLSSFLEELEKNAKIQVQKGDNMYMKLGIDKIPPILLDNTDRNRTSPFAFTGNKFEFRAVGSSDNCASPMIVLNTIVADQLREFRENVDERIKKGTKKELAIINELREVNKASKSVLFEGNNYSDKWVKEAEKRGLPNLRQTPEALDVYISDRAKDLFGRTGIFTESELEARHEIMMEKYIRQVQIESRVMGDIAQNHIIPVAIDYQNRLIKNVYRLKKLGLDTDLSNREETIKRISSHINLISEYLEGMLEARKNANTLDIPKAAHAYRNDVKPYFEKIRYNVDKLELLVDDSLWPIPKYREMLFIR